MTNTSAPAPQPTAQDSWIAAGITGALFLGAYLWFTSDSDDVYNPANGNEATMAFVMCQRPVRDMLRAPDSAEFPNIASPGVSSTHVGGGIYKVRGYVDAQNAFGARLRNQWECEIQEDQAKLWSVKSFSMK